jgi:hypothetical protein
MVPSFSPMVMFRRASVSGLSAVLSFSISALIGSGRNASDDGRSRTARKRRPATFPREAILIAAAAWAAALLAALAVIVANFGELTGAGR